MIRLARDAELELDDEGGRTQLELVERELRRRRRSGVDPTRGERGGVRGARRQAARAPRHHAEDVYVVPGPLDLRFLMDLTDLPGIDVATRSAASARRCAGRCSKTDLFSLLDERDAAPAPSLRRVRSGDRAGRRRLPTIPTCSRSSRRCTARVSGSPFIASLQRAAERNKQVTVLVELTARFDEERNIHWARALEEAGAHVIYGVRGYKTHAKICLIVRRSPQGLRRYVHLGTGNYNERTARIYTDFGLITTLAGDRRRCDGVLQRRHRLLGSAAPQEAGDGADRTPPAVSEVDRRERRRAEAGQPAEIMAKMNSLIDEEIIEALYAAAGDGVRIQLNVRGICALRPGVPNLSENIEVVSIVDRFLEHSRIYYFLNGGDEEVYLASADWMTRNLDKRVELMFPVEDAEHRSKVLYALRAMFRDNVKARWLGADGIYRRREPVPGEPVFRVQQHLQDEARRLSTLARGRAGVTFRPEEGKARIAKSTIT